MPCGEAAEEMNSALTVDFGNPSSLHVLGFNAEKRLNECRRYIADMISANAAEIYFNSGATEGNNTAVLGMQTAFSAHQRRSACGGTGPSPWG